MKKRLVSNNVLFVNKTYKVQPNKSQGFTLTEILIGLAIVGLLITIASPALSQFVTSMRVDDEISSMHRALLQARNQAITSGQNVTLCPLDSSNKCSSDWHKELTIFTDDNRNQEFDSNDVIIQKKDAIDASDTIDFPWKYVTYSPEGRVSQAGSFHYCPSGYEEKLSRAVVISISGRVYQSSDTDTTKDGIDNGSDGKNVKCD